MYFESKISRIIELTPERRNHIIEYHPDIAAYLSKIGETLKSPSQIRRSRHDAEVMLFYKHFTDIKKGKYLVVVVKINERNFVLTCYLTDKIITGEKFYEQ